MVQNNNISRYCSFRTRHIVELTFIVESVYPVDGGALVITAQQEEILRILDLNRFINEKPTVILTHEMKQKKMVNTTSANLVAMRNFSIYMLLIDSLPIFLHILLSKLCNCDQMATVPVPKPYTFSYYKRKVRFRNQKHP
jgi:hypothetical protein